MLTGLVYLIVIALWALILVPRWLRRHDRNAELRSSMRFDRAMKTLSRRGRGVSSTSHNVDVTVTGARNRVHDSIRIDSTAPSPIDAHLDGGLDPFEGSLTDEQLRDARRRQTRSAAQAASAHRRKQVQQVLAGVSLVAFILMIMGVISFMMFLLAPIALAGFTYLSRRQSLQAERTETRLRRSEDQRASTRRSTATGLDEEHEEERLEHRTRRSSSRRQSSRSRSSERRRSSARTVQPVASYQTAELDLAATGTEDVRVLSSDEAARHTARRNTDPGWSPVEAPLPQYVTRDRATDFPRNLDSTTNGDWTSERMLEQVEALRAPGADAESELGLDEFVDLPDSGRDTDEGYDYRRAVND